jgi:hypothetical protein
MCEKCISSRMMLPSIFCIDIMKIGFIDIITYNII